MATSTIPNHAKWRVEHCRDKHHQTYLGLNWCLCQVCHYGYYFTPDFLLDYCYQRPKLMPEEDYQERIKIIQQREELTSHSTLGF